MKKRRIRRWIIVIIILCIPALFILGRIGAYALSWAQEPTTDINDYLQHERAGWLDDSPYDIFPDSANVSRANETKYFYKKLISPTFLFDNEVLEYLTCKFTPEDFYLERQRLELLCGEENTTFFKAPAFIRAEWFPNRFSSYAICNETDYSITYIATQGKLLFEEYVPLELYPREWPW